MSLAFISHQIVFIDPLFSSGDDTQPSKVANIIVPFLCESVPQMSSYKPIRKRRNFAKKSIDFSTFSLKKISYET